MHWCVAFTCSSSGSNLPRVCRMCTPLMWLLLFVFVAGYKSFSWMRGHAHSGPDQPGDRSASEFVMNSPSHQRGKVDQITEMSVRQVQVKPVSVDRAPGPNLTNVFLGKLIARTFLLISPSKQEKKANHLGCVAPVCRPAVQLLNRL